MCQVRVDITDLKANEQHVRQIAEEKIVIATRSYELVRLPRWVMQLTLDNS